MTANTTATEISPRTVDELRDAVAAELQRLCDQFGADTATFHLYDETQDRVIFPVGVGLRQKPLFIWLPSERGPAANVLRGGVAVFAEDAEHHPVFRGRFTYDEGVRSGAAFPLIESSGKKFGIIFLNYRKTHGFPSDEKDDLSNSVMEAFAQIQPWVTGKLWSEVKFQAGLRREHVALQEIAIDSSRLLEDTEAVVWLYDKEKGLAVAAHSGLEGFLGEVFGNILESSPDNFIGRTFLTQEIHSAAVGSSAWPANSFHNEGAVHRRWQSGWAFPMAAYGVLTVYTVGHGVLSKHNQALGSAFANRAKATIEAHNQIRTLETLSDTGNKLNLRFQETEDLLATIVEAAAFVMEADWITLHQYNPVRKKWFPVKYSVTYPPEARQGLKTPRERAGASAFVRDEGRIVISDMDKADPKLVRTAHVGKLGVKAYIGIRLEANGETLGVLFFNYRQTYAFTRDHMTVVNLFADYAATALQNARLVERLRERGKDLSTLNVLGGVLTSGMRLRQEEILNRIYTQTKKLMDTRNLYVALYDADRDTVSFALAFENGKRAVVGQTPWAERKAGQGATEAIIRKRQPLFFRTAAIAKEWYAQPENKEYSGSIPDKYGYIGVPMSVGNRVIGVIAVRNHESDNAYDEDDLTTLSAIAGYAAIALDNATLYYDVIEQLHQSQRLLERRYDEITILNEMGRVLTTGIRLKETQIVELVHQQASRLINMDNCYIALYDSNRDRIRFALVSQQAQLVPREQFLEGSGSVWVPRQAGTGRTEDIIRSRSAILHKTRAEAEAWYRRPGHKEYVGTIAHSWVGVPMVAGDTVIGVIAAYHPESDNIYTNADLALLQSIASQAAIALDSAFLYYERIQELEMVQEVIKGIASERDIGRLMLRVAEEAKEIVHADGATIYQYDPTYKEFYLQMSTLEHKHPIPKQGGTSQAVVQHGEIVFADDAPSDPILGTGSFVSKYGVKSCMAAPLKVGQETVGILYVNFFSDHHHFTEDEQRILTIIAGQAAIGIQAAGRLYDANRQLKVVLDSIAVARECETLDDLLDTYLRRALEAIGAEHGTIQLLDKAADRLVVRVHRGSPVNREFQIISAHQGITGRALKEGGPVYVEDILVDSTCLTFFDDTQSELAVPLTTQQGSIGVLNAESPRLRAFNVSERRLLSLFAEQAAVLISERQKLEEAERRRLDDRSSEMTRNMAHHIKNYLGSARYQLDSFIQRMDLSSPQRMDLARVDANMKRCIEITKSLFKPYKSDERRNISPRILVRNALDLFGQPSGIEVKTRIADDLPDAWIEIHSATDYIHELLINAAAANERAVKEGTVELGMIEISAYLDELNHIVLCIANNGPAIAKTLWETIFEQFTGFSKDETGAEHFGLGLWGARTFFRRLGGEVSVLRSDDERTEFSVTLPTRASSEQGAGR